MISPVVRAQTRPTTATASTQPDAAPLYRQAFGMIGKLNDADGQRLGLCGTDGCWVVKTPLDKGAGDLLGRQAATVALVRKAATMPAARWDLDGDAQKMVAVANNLPRLSALLVLNARNELRAGRASEAVDDLILATAVSRHASVAEPTMVTKMAEMAAARPVVEALAADLPSLPKELVATLPARLAALPPSPTMSQIVRGEQVFARATAPKQGMAVVVMVSGMNNFYDALAKAGTLPPGEFDKVVDEQIATYGVNPFAGILGPSFKRSRESVAWMETKQAMLLTAIDVVQHGDAAAVNSKDPAGGGPFVLKRNVKGFTLTSALTRNGKPAELVVGEQ
jgi:hypothetical protein